LYERKTQKGLSPLHPKFSIPIFEHEFSPRYTANKAYVIQSFLEKCAGHGAAEQMLECLVMLYRHTVATEDQMRRLLEIKGYEVPDKMTRLLKTLVKAHFLNCFTYVDRPYEQFPHSAALYYTLDHGGKNVLTQLHNADVETMWKSAAARMGPSVLTMKMLTNDFFLMLLDHHREDLEYFDVTVSLPLTNRTFQTAALFRVTKGDISYDYLFDAIPHADLPGYWRKKVSEKFSPFFSERHWRQVLQTCPEVILLADYEEDAAEVGFHFGQWVVNEPFFVAVMGASRRMEDTQFFKVEEADRLVPFHHRLSRAD